MATSEVSPALSRPGELLELLWGYVQSNASKESNAGNIERLRNELHAVFCAGAAASVPIEQALATIHREVDLYARSTCGWQDRTMQPLSNLVMMSCLECYYPET